MSVTLTKHEIAPSRDEPVIGTRGRIVQYRVAGLPPEEMAFIANFGGSLYEESWRVFHTKKGIDAGWNGDSRGCPIGSPEEDWYRAGNTLRQPIAAAAAS